MTNNESKVETANQSDAHEKEREADEAKTPPTSDTTSKVSSQNQHESESTSLSADREEEDVKIKDK